MRSIRPRCGRPSQGSEIAEACPELARDFPEPPIRGFGIVGKIAAEEVLKALRLDAAGASRTPVSGACLGAQELSSSVLQAWAAGFLSSPKKGLVATPYGKVEEASGRLDRTGPSASAVWRRRSLMLTGRWVVHQDGAVTPGHQGTPCWASKDAQLHWSTEANWHGHRHVVNLSARACGGLQA